MIHAEIYGCLSPKGSTIHTAGAQSLEGFTLEWTWFEIWLQPLAKWSHMTSVTRAQEGKQAAVAPAEYSSCSALTFSSLLPELPTQKPQPGQLNDKYYDQVSPGSGILLQLELLSLDNSDNLHYYSILLWKVLETEKKYFFCNSHYRTSTILWRRRCGRVWANCNHEHSLTCCWCQHE